MSRRDQWEDRGRMVVLILALAVTLGAVTGLVVWLGLLWLVRP